MKHLLLLCFLGHAWFSYGQLTFVELKSPNDFNLRAVRKSPIGEYFIQASNDRTSIYSSMDDHTWTKDTLPHATSLYEIQFFSDGTPILTPTGETHLIRRNGNWYPMIIAPGYGEIEATFIKDDTLFAYDDQRFAYSMDKGQSFIKVFDFSAHIVDQTSHLWKFEHYFVLHHTAGSSDTLSVFNENGQRVMYEPLQLTIPSFVFNSCGEILLFENFNYYRLKEQGLVLTHGTLGSIFPTNPFDFNLISVGGNYYYFDKTRGTLYQSAGCNFTWDTLVHNNLMDSLSQMWINQQVDIILYNYQSDSFTEETNGSNTWENHLLNVDFAFVKDINESSKAQQATLTSNSFFTKNVGDLNWKEPDSPRLKQQQILYSPEGDLYVNGYDHLSYSKDNGQTFTTIPLPDSVNTLNSFKIYVPDNNIIVLFDYYTNKAFYTLDNGQHWIEIPGIGSGYSYQVKRVNNFIIISILDYHLIAVKINMTTNEITIHVVDEIDNIDFYETAMLDDGTIYFQANDINYVNPTSLYRYRFDEGLEFVGASWDLDYVVLISAGFDLYYFTGNSYHLFNGHSFDTYDFTDLPLGEKKFIVADNEYLYVIEYDHRIFRSTEPLSFMNRIHGSIYSVDADCILDSTDLRLTKWQVKVESDDFMRIKATDANGNFNFTVPYGNYTLSTHPVNAHWELCDPGYNVNVDEDHVEVHQDFMAKALTICADIDLDFSTPFLRRCMENYYSIRVRNTGPDASGGTSLVLQLDPYFNFTSATIPYTQVEAGIFRFELGTLDVNEEITFRIYFLISCDAVIGTEHCLKGTIYDKHSCSDSRSVYTECQENIGSVDPNDKRIFNESGKETEQVDKGEYIYYQIRFQNTGTDTAFTVQIVDPLSSSLDLSTLDMLSSSQPYSYSLTDGPALRVVFENILLPDSSTNEPSSHGFIKFRIKPLPEFDYGTTIPNQADIYFDFNQPVRTNKATLSILPPLATHETERSIDLNVFPNPAKESISLVLSEEDRNRVNSYEIIDPLGKTVIQSELVSHPKVDVSQMVPGIYLVILKKNGTTMGLKRFVKI